MKRIILGILFAMLATIPSQADKTMNFTVLIGHTFTAYAAQNLGISVSDISSTNYTVSDNSAFSITKPSKGVYALIPHKTGTYTFTVSITWKGVGTFNQYQTSRITYILKVIDKILVSSIAIDKTQCELNIGDNLQLSATVLPSDADNKTVSWSSSNTNVASVSNSGIVTALSAGISYITASTTDGSNLSVSCEIQVLKNNHLIGNDVLTYYGGKANLQIWLTNEDIVSGLQFDLHLPSGCDVTTDEAGNVIAEVAERSNGHSLTGSIIADNTYRFVLVSLSGKALDGNEGQVMSIPITVAKNVEVGDYDIVFDNIELTINNEGNYAQIYPKSTKAILTITDVVPGDVNGDDKVSVTDVISIIGYILNDVPDVFDIDAADVTGDGKVSVTDVVSIIDMILENN